MTPSLTTEIDKKVGWGFAGLYDPSGRGMAQESVSQLLRPDARALDADLAVLSFPTEKPVLTIAVVGEARGVSTVKRADGALALLAGDVYNAAELTGGEGSNAEGGVTGCLLERCLRLGPSAFSEVNGDASMVVWDPAAEQLMLFRARSGIPSLFYAEQDGALLFASDLKTLVALGAERSVHLEALDFFLARGYVPAPWTMLRAVKKVPPGQVVVCRKGRVHVERYWWPVWRPKYRGVDAEIDRHLQILFEQALRRRMPAAGDCGVLLSGGVDSALVLAGLATFEPRPSIKTFTFHYLEYEGIYNEVDRARAVADHFHVPHQVIEYGPVDVLQNLERFVLQYEEPIAFGLHSALLGAPAREGVHVLFTGAAGDLSGFSRSHHLAAELARIPRPVLRLARGLLSWANGHSALGQMGRSLDLVGLPPPLINTHPQMTPSNVRRRLFATPGWADLGVTRAVEIFKDAVGHMRAESYRDQLTFLRLSFEIPEKVCSWFSRWSYANGLNVRNPFCDNDLLAFFLRLKRRYTDKNDLRRFARSLMPAEMAYGPKVPQTIPIGPWLRGRLRELLSSYLNPDRVRDDGIFAPDAVQHLIDRHVSGEVDNGWTLLTLLTFTVWMDVFLKRTPSEFLRSSTS